MTELPADIAEMSFEQAYAELSEIVEQMEGGSATLEDSVALYERGEQLATHCEALLDRAELRVRQVDEADVG